ncbi:MAG: hypothetical protein HYS81_02755 [Candidatus Aenigmatarchaeota archaeon]|nr:MAG: hypothetical protein HYS81_02755 [Candidatus Aenigmarchaeota archaeon]
MLGFVERYLGFRVNWTRVAFLAAAVVAIAVAVLGLLPASPAGIPFAPSQTEFQRQEQQFLEKVESGEVEPVLTQEVRVTSAGFDPQFALIEFVQATQPGERGVARVLIRNADSRVRTIVLGQNDVRTLTPGYQFTLTFNAPTEIEIWDKDAPSVRGKIFVR